MTVLVGGAGGFVGATLSAVLLKSGFTVLGGVREGGSVRRLASFRGHRGFRAVALDLTNPNALTTAFEHNRVDAVINCAAHGAPVPDADLFRSVAVNVTGAAQLYAAAERAGVERFIHIGTAFEYGLQSGPVTESTPLRPVGVYGSTKAAASLLLLEQGRSSNTALAIVRLFNLYGASDASCRLGARILEAARTRQVLPLTPGTERRDFWYVKDAVSSVTDLLTLPLELFPAREVINIASGTPTTMRDFAVTFAERAGAAGLLRFGALPARTDRPGDLYTSADKWHTLCRRAGLVPRRTSISEAVVEILAYDGSSIAQAIEA